MLKSGELVTPDRDVERCTLRLATPGIDRGTTHTITAALQLLLPGECAPAHRHTPTAIRWILQGRGAYTTVEGDKCYMEPRDLILTPSWTWHDHSNEGSEAMIWLDGLGRYPVPYPPLWHYKWDRTSEALTRLAEVDASPFDDVAMEFSDPTTGRPVLRTRAYCILVSICWNRRVCSSFGRRMQLEQ